MGGMTRFLISNKLTLILLVAFAGAMGYATFLENDFGTAAARAVVYDTWWFELLMAGLGINFIGNIFRYQLYLKEKWSILLFHVAFIVILVGAMITRYTGFEGLIRIREGNASDIVISQNHYLQLELTNGPKSYYYEKPLRVSSLTPPNFEESLNINGESVVVRSLEFIPDAEKVLADGIAGEVVIALSTATEQGRMDHLLERHQHVTREGMIISFDQEIDQAIVIEERKGSYWLRSPLAMEFMVMSSQQMGKIPPDSIVVLQLRTLYQSAWGSLVVSNIHEGKKVRYETTDDKEAAKALPDLLKVEVSGFDETKTLTLAAREGLIGSSETIQLGDYTMNLNYGPKPIHLPFRLFLNDFQLERYPGSISPSSYASEITVQDGAASFPYRIFMNNVLDYQGYRFFQASYDLDEHGTVLSVNRDWWGTHITYLGYLLMGLGMMLALFGKNTRFQYINNQLQQLKLPAASLVLTVFLCSAQGMYANHSVNNKSAKEPRHTNAVSYWRSGLKILSE